MCVVSMVTEHYTDKWNKPRDWYQGTGTGHTVTYIPGPPSAEEIAEFRKLLERAREYDKKNDQPDCDLEIKKKALLDMAKLWNIDISFVYKDKE